jgi:hypothetical protein
MEEMKNGRTKEREKTASLHYYLLRRTNKSVVGQAVLLRCIATSLLFLASMGSVGTHSKWLRRHLAGRGVAGERVHGPRIVASAAHHPLLEHIRTTSPLRLFKLQRRGKSIYNMSIICSEGRITSMTTTLMADLFNN